MGLSLSLITRERGLLHTEGNMRSADKDSCILPWSNWLALRAGKMHQILCCDWLREHKIGLSCLLGITRFFPQDGSSNSSCRIISIIKPLLTKFNRSRRLDIVVVLFLCVNGPIRRTSTRPLHLAP